MKNRLIAAISPINNPAVPNMPKNPEDAPNVLGNIISSVLSLLLIAAAIWVFVQFLWAGFFWISSGGDKDKLEQARSRMINAVIGLITVASSWAIYVLVLNFLGINSGGGINLSIPSFF